MQCFFTAPNPLPGSFHSNWTQTVSERARKTRKVKRRTWSLCIRTGVKHSSVLISNLIDSVGKSCLHAE